MPPLCEGISATSVPAALALVRTPITLVATRSISRSQHVLASAIGARQVSRITFSRSPKSGVSTWVCKITAVIVWIKIISIEHSHLGVGSVP
jgi:hypothetical protein